MENPKIQQNDKGQLIVTLPASGWKVTLSPPKGKHLKQMDALSTEGSSNIDIMMNLVSMLCPDLSVEKLDEMDAEDVMALGVALKHFRAFA